MKHAMLFSMMLVWLTFAGCGGGVRAPLEGRADPHAPAQIHFVDRELRRDTAVGTPSVSRDESGLLFVTIPVRSAINQTLHVDYRVTFFDRNGQPLSQTGWFTKVLAALTPDQITVNSMSPQAADFQVDFRHAR